MTAAVWAGVVVLAVGTYLARLCGVLIRSRADVPARAESALDGVVVAVLVAVAVGSTLFDGAEPASPARIAGVAVALALARRRVPVGGVVVGAAVTCAAVHALTS